MFGPTDNRLSSPDALRTDSLPDDWRAALDSGELADRLGTIRHALAEELAVGHTIYPADPWRALRLTALDDVRVVILGQDPYHGPGQAQGLAFSVGANTKVPPSLRNIFLEIARDPTWSPDTLVPPVNPDLSRWAKQGVLLLNTALTVRDGQPASHAKLGWQVITDAIITAVADRPQPCVFMLWGNHAQSKQLLLKPTGKRQLVLTANHPSPLSARRPPTPFIGCGHFSRANEWLSQQGCLPIDWHGAGTPDRADGHTASADSR